MTFNDDDMKIVEDIKDIKNVSTTEAEKEESTYDATGIIAELKRQKRYGNIGRAKMAGSTATEQAIDYIDNNENEKVKTHYSQSCCILAFGIMTGFERFVHNEMVLRVLLNSFYDELKNENKAFYDSFNDMASMSFYYLASRRNRVDSEAGHIFADLCRKSENQEYIDLGNKLLNRGLEIAEKVAKENNLVKE